MPFATASAFADLAGELLPRYRRVRAASEELCAPLAVEDMVVQSLPDASPAKWHLGHTTWFFETFVLRVFLPGYQAYDERWTVILNSYYDAIGPRVRQPERGALSRPTVEEILAYRRHVDGAMVAFLASPPEASAGPIRDIAFTIGVGLHHEEQHQELILTDVKHALLTNPLEPIYATAWPAVAHPAAIPTPNPRATPYDAARPLRWFSYAGGTEHIGASGAGFAYDNECPHHAVALAPFALAGRLATCGEYIDFMNDGGYRRPELWLSDGWELCGQQNWQAPLYWQRATDDDPWTIGTLRGRRPVIAAEPVAHISYYEADAFARWSNARLPLEAEWEVAARQAGAPGALLESRQLHPQPAALRQTGHDGPAQMIGDVWEWTSSAYAPYPGFTPFAGALGEYNGKFMSNRLVLRGGSCFTPAAHIRATYRNFWLPATRWQMTGFRLARWT